MPDYEFIGKSRLACGLSFPLKRSALDAYLDDRGITTVTGVGYCGPSDDSRVLSADYRGPLQRGMRHSLNLWLNAVPSSICHHITQVIEQELLSRLADWIIQLTDQSILCNQMDHRFEIYYDDVNEEGGCQLDVRLGVPPKQWRLPRFRAKVRP